MTKEERTLILQESARRLGKTTFGQALTPVGPNVTDASTDGSAQKLNSNEASFASQKITHQSPNPLKVEVQFHFLNSESS